MVSKRVASIRSSGIRDIFDMAAEGAINLGLGELDFEPPQGARDALGQACAEGKSKYGPTAGLMALREAIASHESTRSPSISVKNVLITAGATEGIMAICQSLIDPGDEVLVPDPGFVLYSPEVLLAGAKSVPYRLDETPGFVPDVGAIQESVTSRTRAIFVNSPSNPTGGVITKEAHRAITEIAVDHDMWIVSDEVYEDFLYDGAEHFSFSGDLDNAIVVNSFSKSLAVPGWRIGYILADESVFKELTKMQYYVIACPPTPIQHAILAAMPHRAGFMRDILPILDARRRRIVSLLNEIPSFSCNLPRGGFYAFPRYNIDIPSRRLAERIVGAGVINSPGSAFREAGEGHLRFSYAASEDDIARGMGIVRSVVEEQE